MRQGSSRKEWQVLRTTTNEAYKEHLEGSGYQGSKKKGEQEGRKQAEHNSNDSHNQHHTNLPHEIGGHPFVSTYEEIKHMDHQIAENKQCCDDQKEETRLLKDKLSQLDKKAQEAINHKNDEHVTITAKKKLPSH